ncbi:hypothetical protein GGX14DRAFT_578631 [Mycena pura]|uniref:HMG box domain-containing protein n=1 Tax=Mycena pura TaxID=153505 RepID=A0AAD6Y134_9AGAR|nr:hypothetical protein GGX14DRAFT_578631 [Mycena pura]
MSSESAARPPQATPGAAALPPSPGIFSATLHGFTFPDPRVPSCTGNTSALLFHNDGYHTISALAPTLEPVLSTFAPAHRVRRPRNSFMLFRSWCCKENAHGRTQPRANLNDSIRAQWKALSSEQREWWKARAEEEKKEHAARHPGYKYRPQPKVKNGASAAASTTARRRSRAALQHGSGASVSRSPPRQASHLPNVAVLCTFDPPSAPTTSPLARPADEVLSPASNGSQVWASPSLPPPANNPAPLLNMRPLNIPAYRPSGTYAPSPLSPSFGRVPFSNWHSSTPVHGPSTPYTPFSASSFNGTPSLGTSPSSISGSLPPSPYTPAPPSFRLPPPYLASPCGTATPGDRVAAPAYPNYGLGLGCEPPFDSSATGALEAGYSPAQADFIAAMTPAQYSHSTPTSTRPHHEAMQPAIPSSGIFSHGGDGPVHTYPPSAACPDCGLASAATGGLEAGYSPAPLPPQPAQANFFDATSPAQYGHSTPTPMRPHHEVMQSTMPSSGIFSHGGDGPMHTYPPDAFAAASHAGAYYARRGRGHALAGDPGANYPRTPPAHGWDRTRTGGPLPRAPQAPYFPGAASTPPRASRRPGAHQRF